MVGKKETFQLFLMGSHYYQRAMSGMFVALFEHIVSN